MTKLVPTFEQNAAIDLAKTGKNLKIEAFAGAAKTSTQKMIAQAMPDRDGVYLAFNSDIVKEAKGDFPITVECKTTHSFAMRAQSGFYSNAKMTTNPIARDILQALELKRGKSFDCGVELNHYGIANLVKRSLARFCSSARTEISAYDVPMEGKFAAQVDYRTFRAEVGAFIAPLTQKFWDRMIDRKDVTPLGFDGYLKTWALSNPQIDGDYLLLDEAQDTNAVIIDLIQKQKMQVICVGDRYQQIYEWRGAENAMTQLPDDQIAYLSTSFRYGQGIADRAMEVLSLLGADRKLIGARTDEKPVGTGTHCVLARTNGRVISELLSALEEGQRVYVAEKTVKELGHYVDAAEKLMNGLRTDFPVDFVGFANWQDVETSVERDGNEDLRKWVNLFAKFSPSELRAALGRVARSADKADVTITTGHKSKGLQWDHVTLTDDFLSQVPLDKPVTSLPEAELRLLYVAMTRPKYTLNMEDKLIRKLRAVQAAAANGFQE